MSRSVTSTATRQTPFSDSLAFAMLQRVPALGASADSLRFALVGLYAAGRRYETGDIVGANWRTSQSGFTALREGGRPARHPPPAEWPDTTGQIDATGQITLRVR
jgi:hypothetical protein